MSVPARICIQFNNVLNIKKRKRKTTKKGRKKKVLKKNKKNTK